MLTDRWNGRRKAKFRKKIENIPQITYQVCDPDKINLKYL
jgi:hypothetical protein